jgi:flagellin
MSLGVLNNLSAVYAENNLNSTNNSLNTVLQQLSSGSKINSGANDAAGLSLVDGLEANQTALNQSETNATEGVGLLQVADGALSQVTTLLNRAVTLATEASNGTLNSTQDAAANQEYQSILSEISNIGSTTTYNQEQVFGSNTNIYTGDSSTTGASIDDLNIRSLTSANVGDSQGTMSYSNGQNNVFINLSNNGTNASISDSLNSSGVTTINVSYMSKGGDGAAVQSNATISVGKGTNYANTAEGLISAINNSGLGLNATFATAAQAGSAAVATAEAAANGGGGATDTGIEISAAGIGTGSNGVGVVGSMSLASGEVLSGTLNIVGSDGASHNITLGTQNSTDNLNDLAATINAAGYGVTATANQAGTQLTFTSADSAVSVSGTNVAENTLATSQNIVVAGSDLGSITVGSAGDALTGSLNIQTVLNGVTTTTPLALGSSGSTDNLADLAKTINADAAYGITATLNTGSSTQAAGTVLTFTKAEGYQGTASVSDTALTDVASPTLAQGDTLGSLSISAANDTFASGTLDIVTGAGKATTLTLGTVGSTDNLTNLANTINNGGYGITATLDQTGTNLTFTQSSGSSSASITSAPGGISENTFTTTAAVFATGTPLETITLANATDTISDSGGGAANMVITTSDGSATVAMTASGVTLATLASDINGAGTAKVTATLNQAGNELTLTSNDGGTLTNVTDSGGGHFQDNETAQYSNSAITASNGTLGTLSVLNAGNTLGGTLNITSGTSTGGGAITLEAGQTLAQIAEDFNSTASGGTGTEQVTLTGTALNDLGITATLNAAGTELTFAQASGTTNNVHVAAISTSPDLGNLTQTDVIAQGATLGSLSASTVNDTLSGTFSVTSGASAGATPTTISFANQTLAQIAADFNTSTGQNNWSNLGITATLNTTGSGATAGTVLTFTQSAGDAGTAAITNDGYVTDVTAPTTNANINLGGNAGNPTLTAAAAGDTLTGTMLVTPSGGTATAYNFAGQTLAQIAASFNSPDGANYASGITALQASNLITFTTNGGSLSGVGIQDYTPAASANQSVATGTILNTLTAANSTDKFSGEVTITKGLTGGTSGNITITGGQTLTQIAADFNTTGGTQDLHVDGITATLNAAGTQLTFTQTLGDTATANIVSDSGNPLVDTVTASSTANATGDLVAGTGHANSLSAGADADTLTGTLDIVEGTDTNATESTFNLAGQTLQQVADDFNGVNYDTSSVSGYTNLSNLGITADYNATNKMITFVANGGETGAANATVTEGTAIVDQGAPVAKSVATTSGTMLDTITVNSKNDTLGGTLNLTSGISGAAMPAITLGTKGTTDTLANLATTINNLGYGITASLNTAGTEMTLTQNSGDGFAAKATGTSVTDSMSTGIVAGSGLGSLSVNNTTDTLTGTLTGVQNNGSAFTLNLNGETLSQVAAQLNNADSAYGIVATLNQTQETVNGQTQETVNGQTQAAGTVLSFTANSADTGTPTIGNSGSIIDTTVATQTAVNIADVPTSGVANTTALGSLSIAGTDTLSGSLQIGTNTINIGASDNTAATLASAINNGNYGVTAAYNANSGQLTFNSPNSSMSIDTGALDEAAPGSTATAVGSLTGTPTTSSSYYGIGIAGSVKDSSTMGGTANVGVAADANGAGGIATISYSDAAGQSLSSTTLSSMSSAQAALTAINTAITDVAAQDGYIGAQINTLNSVSSVLSTQQENVQSAQNAVQATDYASATSNMSKYEILSQTGIAALAQANSVQQEVMKLLQ